MGFIANAEILAVRRIINEVLQTDTNQKGMFYLLQKIIV
jgi:hypothetical protein